MNTDDLNVCLAFLNNNLNPNNCCSIPINRTKEVDILVLDYGYCKYELVTNKIVYPCNRFQMPPARGLSCFKLEPLHPNSVIKYIEEINNLSDEELRNYISQIQKIEHYGIDLYDKYMEKLLTIEDIHTRAKQLERKIYGNK